MVQNNEPPRRRAVGLQPPVSKEFVPELIDYVVQATCKRIRTIPAQKLCSRGVLNGKMCRVEIEVPPVAIAPTSLEYDVRPPQIRCEDSRFQLLSRTMCLFSETRGLVFICPEGTQDIGDRCVSYSPPTMTCDAGFALESDSTCVQTQEAQPITEWSVTYSCVGKECAN